MPRDGRLRCSAPRKSCPDYHWRRLWPARSRGPRTIRRCRRLLRCHRAGGSALSQRNCCCRWQRQLSRPGSDVPFRRRGQSVYLSLGETTLPARCRTIFRVGWRPSENIEILYNTEIRKMSGGKKLEQIELENTKTGERRVVRTPAVFSMIGARPCTEWLPAEIERDEKGFIKTGSDVAEAPAWRENKRRPAPLETSLPGIFAAGDVRSGSVKRCAAAVGEGGMAVAGIHLSLASRRNASANATSSH